ncbi:MAG: penicillin-binding protein 2 [bacterium]|nr:penicillin-binding protein 2 [bacterium]
MKFSNKYKIKESIGDIETHEVFMDSLAHVKEEQLGISEKKFEVKIKEKIIYAMFGLFFLLAAFLFSKTFYFQVFQGKELSAISESNKARLSLIKPERGIIYDKNLTKLVLNSPAFDLVCDKRNYITAKDEYIKEIHKVAGILGLNAAELESAIAASEESIVLILENIPHEKLLVLETRMHELPDCKIEKNTVRDYAMGPIFSHVLGYLGKISKEDLKNSTGGYTSNDSMGRLGLERSYETALRGTPGTMEVIKDATGIKRGDTMLAAPKEGYNLVLNIDAGLQKKTYESLEKSIKNVGATKGAAVALDPRTGAVLSMVSYPAFDNNIFSQGISQADYNELLNDSAQPFFNRVIAAQYPTGSTIKPFIAAGALEEKIISPTKIINDPGYILVHSQNDPNASFRFGGVVPHGDVDMREALAVSSNIYFYTVGGGYGSQKGLGPSGIKKYLDLFGWEEKTGVDIPGEYSGFVPSPEWKMEKKNENWWDGDTYNLSIGQSDLKVTPLHVAHAYSYIANGGTLYKPQIVQKITDSSQKEPRIVEEFKPEVIRSNFIDAENLRVIREGMRDGVQKPYGSSHMLNTLPFSVAGKTGTAETGKAGHYNTWSSNFAPYDNPEIVFVVTIEGVQGLRAASLPVANEVLYWWYINR